MIERRIEKVLTLSGGVYKLGADLEQSIGLITHFRLFHRGIKYGDDIEELMLVCVHGTRGHIEIPYHNIALIVYEKLEEVNAN